MQHIKGLCAPNEFIFCVDLQQSFKFTFLAATKSKTVTMQTGNQNWGICLVQMYVGTNKQQNITNAIHLVKQAVLKYKPKIVVLPEYFNTPFGQQWVTRHAEQVPSGETCVALSNLARDCQIYLVGGSIFEQDTTNRNFIYNTTTVWGPNGNLLTKYRKIHLTDVDLDNDVQIRESDYIKSGNTLSTFVCDGIKVGLGIGYDLCYNELANLYRKDGVDLLIYPSVYPMRQGELYWEQYCQSRAVDNQIYVCCVSQARDYKSNYVFYGHSMLINPHGQITTRAGDTETIIYGHLDFQEIEKYRNMTKVHLNRRHDVYDTILKTV